MSEYNKSWDIKGNSRQDKKYFELKSSDDTEKRELDNSSYVTVTVFIFKFENTRQGIQVWQETELNTYSFSCRKYRAFFNEVFFDLT